MGKVLISAGHGGFENSIRDPGVSAGGTDEAREMILLRDLIITELRSRSIENLSVPDDLSASDTIVWINARAQPGDVALEIHANAHINPDARGAAVYYIANNDQRKKDAELMLMALLRRVPQLTSRGARTDTTSGTGTLPFCRLLAVPSLLIEVAFLTNPEDRQLLQTRRREFALGIADGLSAWLRSVANSPSTPSTPAETTYPPISININGNTYGEQGIVVNGNAYIPIDLVDRLGIDITNLTAIRRVSYNNIVYARAVDLRELNISVGWDGATRTVILRSILKVCQGTIDRIMGIGNTTEVQLIVFLKSNNEAALQRFPDIPRIYREEASIEGVNHDIAFCQMCLETNFLRFDRNIQPTQNNFAGLGGSLRNQTASFNSAREGVMAHVQHLKAYASTEPLVRELVDPRFGFVTRGIAPLVSQMSQRWSADPQYGNRLMALLRRLYESAGLF